MRGDIFDAGARSNEPVAGARNGKKAEMMKGFGDRQP